VCGFAGYVSARSALSPDVQHDAVLGAMGDAIAHRGPDDQGTWVDLEQGIALVHRRLSILDLSQAGHQPMVSASTRYVVVFNGELYNHLELREALNQPPRAMDGSQPVAGQGRWRGHSDTETLLEGFDRWGISSTVDRAVGMYAFVVWDRELRQLTLGRDRVGEKPLYYGFQRDYLLFGSELKALRAHPAFHANVDRSSLSQLLQRSCIPSPRSIYQGIWKLPPGTLLTLNEAAIRNRELPRPQVYWSLVASVQTGRDSPYSRPSRNAVDELDALLRSSISGQLISDVPLGAFLSGGIDSTTVVALMQSISASPVKTFSIGFEEHGYDEAPFAKAVARHLGTEHTELYVSPSQALEVIPKLPQIYDEPFADPSCIPTVLVSELARTEVTVALSGDGGDELFGGYNRYLAAHGLWRKAQRVPEGPRRLLAAMIDRVPPSLWAKLHSASLIKISEPAEKAAKVAAALSSVAGHDFYESIVSHWTISDGLVMGASDSAANLVHLDLLGAVDSLEEQMMLADQLWYLPDDILAKVDRAAMAASLETRVPFLDHRVIEFAWTLPLEMKIRDGRGKWILREVLDRYVPRSMMERPKAGFGVPIGSWLCGPLKEWASELLSEQRLRREGFLHPGPILERWREHQSGKRNWQYWLWDVLMFQAWLEEQ